MTGNDDSTMTELPQDPPGWGIHLTDDEQWKPVRWDGHELDPRPTKWLAVEAIAAFTGDPHVIDQAQPAPNVPPGTVL